MTARMLLVAWIVAALVGATSTAGTPGTAHPAVAASGVADSAYARILVTGTSKVALLDPQGRRCEWTAKGVVARIPGCTEADVTEPADGGGPGEPAIMFSLRRPTTGEYVVEAGGKAGVEVTCNAEWHGPSGKGCAASDTRTLTRGVRTRWGVRWPARDPSDSCRVLVRKLPPMLAPKPATRKPNTASRPASR